MALANALRGRWSSLTHLLLPAMLEARRGGGLVVPRLLNKLSIFSQRFAPRGLVTKVAGRNFRV